MNDELRRHIWELLHDPKDIRENGLTWWGGQPNEPYPLTYEEATALVDSEVNKKQSKSLANWSLQQSGGQIKKEFERFAERRKEPK